MVWCEVLVLAFVYRRRGITTEHWVVGLHRLRSRSTDLPTDKFVASDSLPPRSRVLLENLTGSQLVKRFTAFYGTPKVNYCFHTCSPPVPILSHLDPIHAPTSYFLKIDLNVILTSTPGSYKWSLSLRFPRHNTLYASPLPPYVLHAPPIYFFFFRFNLPNNIWWGVQITKFLII